MNMLTGFSAHLCDVVQKLRRRQKPSVTTLLSDYEYNAFKSYFCDRMRLGLFWSDHIFVMVRAKRLLTLLLYCSKGK